MKFFEFNQNNSGGYFDVDDNLCHRLFIEAETEEEAYSIVGGLGVYFDDCDSDTDCDFCGGRWYGCEEVKLPAFTGDTTVEGYAQTLADKYGCTTPDSRVFYKSGKVTEIFRKGK